MIYTIQAFVTFFTIIDPLGLVPVVISAAIIAFFALVVRFLLDCLGISLYAFDMAGGALLFLLAALVVQYILNGISMYIGGFSKISQ